MTEVMHEYAVRDCAPKASTREALLNHMAGEGWEPFEARRASAFEWSNKDQITFRRPRN